MLDSGCYWIPQGHTQSNNPLSTTTTSSPVALLLMGHKVAGHAIGVPGTSRLTLLGAGVTTGIVNVCEALRLLAGGVTTGMVNVSVVLAGAGAARTVVLARARTRAVSAAKCILGVAWS